MPDAGRHYGIKSKLASLLLAGFLVLLPVNAAHAVASLNLSTSFDPAGTARDADPYMDSGGVWNQDTLSEVTNTTGDGFTLTVQNTAPGATPLEIAANTAYDTVITVDVPTGFRLSSSPYPVTTTPSGVCPALPAVEATQAGGVGTPVTIAETGATQVDIQPGCTYTFDLGLTTTDVGPFVNDGTYSISYDVVYNEEDGNVLTEQTVSTNQNVEVRTGDVALQKTAVTTLAGDGDNVEFTVSLINGGQGGIFEIDVAEILSPDFDPASLNMTTVPAEGSELGVFVNPVYSIPYIGPGAGVIDIQVTVNVQVDPNAASCPILNNTASVTERTGGTNSGADAIAFDLQEPLLTFTAPVINVPLNGGPTAVTVDVINSGPGTAKQVSMVASGATDLDNYNVTVTSPGWVFDSPTDTFTFAGTITSGATETLTFTVETASCPPPAGGNLDWDLGYQNVCGTVFNPAVRSANLNVTNVPDATITKTVSAAALNVGDPGSYTLATGGANLAALPANDGDNTNNNDFTVSDTFPAGIQNISIPAIPAGTEVEVLGVGVFTGSVPAGQIPDGGSIEWRGDAVDLQATPNMQIDFLGGDSATCPTGQTITNNATLTSNCAINDTGGAGFILNENPFGGATFNITVGGDGQFETGAPDTNNADRDEAREGEHIPFNVSYTFPPGYLGGVINWGNLTFNAALRTGVGAGEPLVLTNNRNSVLLTVTAGGAPTACTQTPLSPGVNFTGGDGASPLDIGSFAFVPALCGIGATVDDVTLLLEYSATSAEGTLAGPDPYTDDPVDQANVGTYIENTTLSIVGAPPGCTGNPDFIQGITVDLISSDLDMNGSIGAGGIAVCEVVPVTVDLNELNPDTTADNVLFNLGLTDLQIVDGADAPSTDVDADITRAGGFAGFTLTSPPGNNTGPVDYELQPNTTDLTGNGTLSFNARVLDVAAAFNATVSFDSKHSSPDAGGDADRDFSFPLNVTPANIRSADLDLEFFPNQLILRDQTNYTFRAHIVNTGDGDAVGGVFQITLPPEMNYVSSSSIPAGVVGVSAGQTITWDLGTSALGDLGTGEAIDIDINVSITQNSCFQGGPADDINSQTDWGCGIPNVEALLDTPPIVLPSAQLTLTHDLNNSFCELCNVGEVHLFVRNTGGVLLTDVEVTENLLATGLEYVPNSTTCIADEGTCSVIGEPDIAISPGNYEITWTSSDIQIDELGASVFDLYSSFSTAPNTPQQVEIIFQVRRTAGDLEGLIGANRNIQASGQYGLFCDQLSASPVRLNALDQTVELPIQQPIPQVDKEGRNVSAGQTSAQYTDDVFGGRGDSVIFRINIENTGNADLEDLLFNDQLQLPNNFAFHSVCFNETDATNAETAGGPVGGCIAPDALQSHDEEVGGPGGVDILQGNSTNVFLVGDYLNLCLNTANDTDVEWGCSAETVTPGPGGITAPATTDGITPPFDRDDVAAVNSFVDPDLIDITNHTVTGVDGGPELGYRGRVRLTIENNSEGTIKNLVFKDTLPAGYAVDLTSLVPANNPNLLTLTTAFGNSYTGEIDRIVLTNPQPNDEDNTEPEFELLSTPGVSGSVADDENLLRVGDSITISYDIVRVQDFDVQADPEVFTENAATCTDPEFPVGFTPGVPTACPGPGNEPPYAPLSSNRVDLGFSNSCDVVLKDFADPNTDTLNNIEVDPEDLDININPADPDKVYVLSNPADTLDLTVRVDNNGGHNADNHFILVTIGSGLDLPGGPPAGCSSIGNPPPPRAVWVPGLPSGPSPPNPPPAEIFQCDTGVTFAAGAVRTYTFTVQREFPAPVEGSDLTFRADVVGEITLRDGSALTFPTPDTTVISNVANNYSLDSVRARIIGFNLNKTITDCREQAAFASAQKNADVAIGEDCTYRLRADWFGFASPGFGQITISDITIQDNIDAGQGFISETITPSGPAAGQLTPDTFTSTPAAVAAPNEITQAQWEFNLGGVAITDDVTIDADIVTRARNDALDASAPPNNHAANTTNTADVSFRVDFDGPGGNPSILFNSSSANYPPLGDRRADIDIAEPNLTSSNFKQVCNETINPDCDPSSPTYDPSLFADTASGDVNDSYIYRIRIANAQSVGGTTSKPAFDVVVNDVLDLFSETVGPAFVGIDNDSDSIIDVLNPTAPVIGGTAPTGAPPRTLTFDSTTTPVLAQVDADVTVDLFYRVDADNTAIPGQMLTNNVTIDYDSLAGASGNQDAPQLPTSDPGGARAYQITDSATVNLLVPSTNNDSKAIINTSLFDLGHTASLCPPDAGNTYCTGLPLATNPQRVSIGEEVRFQFEVGLPAATYNNLTITDELPPGLDCTGVDDISLDPSSFSPSTSPVWPADFTCDADTFEVRFGTREVTALPTATLTVTFVARVENLNSLREATNSTITNVTGGGRVVRLSYEDSGGNPQAVPLGPAVLTIAEPDVVLDKTFSVASADAGDRVTVTVTADNDGSAPAFNLRILDDLTIPGINLTFDPNPLTLTGDIPDNVDTASPNNPVFSWNTPLAPDGQPGESITFSFDVIVDNAVQPLEVLENTIEAAWTSLPDSAATVALSTDPGSLFSSGPGADGTGTGMRIGAIPNAGDPLNNYESSFLQNNLAVPAVTMVKTDITPALTENQSIGARRDFEIVISLPEGETTNLDITDNLAQAGLSYILENNATAGEITYTFSGIDTINTNAVVNGAPTTTPPPPPFSEPADGASGLITWNIGTVVTQTEQDPGVTNPSITINYRARINNGPVPPPTMNAGDSLANSATMTYTSGLVPPTTENVVSGTGPITVLEPEILPANVIKSWENITPGKALADLPDGDDIIRYTVTIPNSGGSPAFDVNIVDTIPPELSFDSTFTPTITIGAGAPFNLVPGQTAVAGGTELNWGRGNNQHLLDIPEGESLVLTYQVRLQDVVEPNQVINNSVWIDWTSQDTLPPDDPDERNGAGCPATTAPNTYCVGPVTALLNVADDNAITKTRTDDTFVTGDSNVRVGDIVEYTLTVNIQEGITNNIQLVDTLPEGLDFIEVISVNGDTTAPYTQSAPFSYSDIAATSIVEAGDPRAGPTTVTWSLGNITNVADNNTANDGLVIVYRALVLDQEFAQAAAATPVVNSVDFTYDTATIPSTQNDTETINLLHPVLSVTKTAPLIPDAVLDADEVVRYQVDISNTGLSPAYDTVLRDIIPVGMRNGALTVTTVSIELLSGAVLPDFAPVYDSATGIATWDFDSGIDDQYTIPPGDTLRIVYDVQVDSDASAGLILNNQAQVQLYYSFDDEGVPVGGSAAPVREIYGPSNISTVNLITPGANPMDKDVNPLVTQVAIGETFTYRITIPDAGSTLPIALHDVRIFDDMSALGPAVPGVEVGLVSISRVSGSLPWNPVNTAGPDANGRFTNLVIEDSTGNGIDIPPNEVIAIDVTVVVTDNLTPPVDNNNGDLFVNTADYSFNQIDDDPATEILMAGADTSPQIEVIEPDLTLEKRGLVSPPALVQFGIDIPYTLVADNIGTSAAYDVTFIDLLPSTPNNPPLTGGTCDTPPAIVDVRVVQSANEANVLRTLSSPADYTTMYTPAPTCELRITAISPAAAIQPGEKLMVDYTTRLDINSQAGAVLENTASIFEYFSQDTAGAGATGEIRRYPLVPVTDTHQVTVDSPVLSISKSVINVTTGQVPVFPTQPSRADPGQILEYSLTVTNLGDVPVDDFDITDELDRLAPSGGYFEPNTLNVITPMASLPGAVAFPGSPFDFSSGAGGSNGTGLVDIRNLRLDASGGADDSFTIVFQVELQPIIASGTIVTNQAEIDMPGFQILLSHDPYDDVDDPFDFTDDDPTETIIGAVPGMDIQKSSQDITGDAAILAQGDTLRYTIEAQNVGSDDLTGTTLRDQIPANTTYVANSTTLNGVPVSDPSPGVSRVEAGLLINAPENTTPGFMATDFDPDTNVATITFDVQINGNVVNGTVISNQAFVSGTSADGTPSPEFASDDPATPDVFGDPTQDIVGNLPILDAEKTVSIVVDNGTADVVDVGDRLEYTIRVTNTGPVAATVVNLIDAIPTNSTYFADSVVVSTDSGDQSILDANLVSTAPLIIRLNSDDLPLHAQAANDGQINPGQQAIVRFQVDATGAVGSIISNQGTITSAEQPDELTDADGNDENGDQPTEVIIGQASTLSLTKEVFVVGGGLAQPGGTLEYVIRVTNTGVVNATNIVIDDVVPADVTYVPNSARVNGSTAFNGGAVTEPGASLQVNYQNVNGALEPGELFTVAFQVTINSPTALGTLISNTATASWNEMLSPVADTADIEVGGAPGVGVMMGRVWHETERETSPAGPPDPPFYTDGVDPGLPGWTVNVLLNNTLFASVVTEDDGSYQIIGLPPSGPAGGDYDLRFIPPGGSNTSASMGPAINQDVAHLPVSGTPGEMSFTGITLGAGANIPEQNQPVVPQGIVYNSIERTPVAGATLDLLQPNGSPAPAACLPLNANQQTQTTLASGFYRFDIQGADPGCTVSSFIIEVTEPATGFSEAPSQIIPPGLNSVTQINVPTCGGGGTGDTLTTTAACDVQNSAFAPSTSTPARTDSTPEQQGTTYYLEMVVNANGDVAFNNHIPVDPLLDEAISISKTSALLNVTRSQLVPYTITLNNTLSAPLQDLDVIDNFPAGFKYIAGSARIQGTPTEPVVNGLTLTWPNLSVNTQETMTIKMLLVVGSGVGEGEYVNSARVINNRTGGAASGTATATVRVVPDPTFDCSDVIGKVFDDKNLNGYQDEGEPGLSGVRVTTAKGLLATTDEYGRFHITCAVVPNEDRGSNFIMKLDDRTLPSGYRVTTENPRVQRATRGKMLKFNFGAAIHRVVRLDMADAVFEPDTTDIRPQWVSRISLLLEKLREQPSVLRLSYLADLEDEDLVEDRLEAVKDQISDRWKALDCCYKLTIETEVFWRRGAPVDPEELKP